MQPQDPAPERAPGCGHLRASDADRERVLETLKTAFVQGRLTTNELGRRAGLALASRTYAELAAATDGIPAGPAATPPPRPAVPARRRPVSRRVITWGLIMLILTPALGAAFVDTYDGGFIILFVLAFIAATVTAPPAAPPNGRRGAR